MSVLEHIGPERDATALAELWRVLKPGGVLHLTTDVSVEPKDVFVGGEDLRTGQRDSRASRASSSSTTTPSRTSIAWRPAGPWQVDLREFAAQKNPDIERRFYARVPWSYLYGPLLRFRLREQLRDVEHARCDLRGRQRRRVSPAREARRLRMSAARRALVIGAAGQDGSYLTELLVEKGYDVTGRRPP